MPLTPRLREKFLAAFNDRIREGEEIERLANTELPECDYTVHIAELQGKLRPSSVCLRLRSRHKEWLTRCLTLLDQIVPSGSLHRKWLDELNRLSNGRRDLTVILNRLRAVKADFESGLLDDLAAQVESEIAADYMGQAEQLLREGQPGKYDHVPAAVLAGAVLEKALRSLCARQTPAIPADLPDGRRKMLNAFIDDAKRAGLYNETRAKQLRSWAAIRNHAAHGEFDEFTRHQVENMVSGIADFLASTC